MTDRFTELFGIERPTPFTKEESQKQREINTMVDEMKQEYGFSTLELFTAAAEAKHFAFLHSVTSCPEFVLEFCRHKLAPDALGEHRAHKKQKHERSVRETEQALEKLQKTAPR